MIALSFFALFLVTVSGYQVATRSRSLTMMSEKSKALPFLKKPAKLDGTAAGDFGFDPLGFTDMFSMNYIKSSELKHARVAMLATVGFLVQQNFHFLTTESNPFKQVAELGFGKNLQILSFIGVIELATWTKSYMSGGDYGFDPLNFSKGKTDAQMKDLAVKEIKNGRLAMIAIIGLFAQTLKTEGF